jgi:hypothetical protein
MLNKLPEIFLRPFPYWDKVNFFRKTLYLFLLINALVLLPIIEEIYGYHGIIGGVGWDLAEPWYSMGSRAFLFILNHPINSGHGWIMYVFVIGQIFALIAGLWNFYPKLASVLVYFFTANLFNRAYLVFTGGEVLITLLLFYLMFIHTSNSKGQQKEAPAFTLIQTTLNNTFYWILLLQVVVLYLFSTIYKMTDPLWMNGSALMYISELSFFSGDAMSYLFSDNLILSQVFTYLVLFYQGLFPILVWVKQIKIPYLILGVAIHLGIAWWMGIFTFGITMCISYILFLTPNQLVKLKLFFARPLRRIFPKAKSN